MATSDSGIRSCGLDRACRGSLHDSAGRNASRTLTPDTMAHARHDDGAAAPCPCCATCRVRTVCLPHGLAESPEAVGLMYRRKRLKRDEPLCRMGAPADSLYAVRNGFLESRCAIGDGREQVTGFHMPGDIVGMDAIATGLHGAAVVALEDTEICVIAFARLEQPEVQRHVHMAMTHELSRVQARLLSLGTLCAEERVAAFLVGLSQRMRALGYARDEFHLRMSREDIGSYLGMALETACRILMRFHRAGMIAVNQKRIRILDMRALAERSALAR